MGVREILAARSRKRFRWAILRPKDHGQHRRALERLSRGSTPDDVAEVLRDLDTGHYIFVGYAKPKCMKLFDANGFPTGDTMQPGDVLDEIEMFNRAIQAGAYQPTGEHVSVEQRILDREKRIG